MPDAQLQTRIADKTIEKETLAEEVIANPEMLPEVVEGLGAEKADIKYGSEKILRLISEKRPETLYPLFDFFVELLDSEVTFHRYGAIKVIGNLAEVDRENKFEKIFDKYFEAVPGPTLIPAANTVGAAAKIALAKPALTERITAELLKVEKGKYETEECHNIVLGKAIEAFYLFFDQIEDPKPVIALARKQLKNTRNATRKKAEKFLKKYAEPN